ncbi:MAG: PAS domain S-box protein [Chloroflexi bacterium]|nr:PAS domain S-box protein [Chloroflexota bacterium]
MITSNGVSNYALFDSTTANIIVFRGHDVHFANCAAHRLLGFQSGTMAGQTLADLLLPEDYIRLRQAFAHNNDQCDAPGCIALELQLRDAAGQPVWVDFSVAPDPLGDSDRWIATVLDARARKQTEMQLADTSAREHAEAVVLERERLALTLESQREMTAIKERIMKVISHEFRTPLAIILTSSQLLERYFVRLGETQRDHYFAQIHAQIDHLTEMLDEIGLIVRGELGQFGTQMRHFNLDELCVQVVKRLYTSIGVDYNIIYNYTGSRTDVTADHHMIQRMLTNLIDNAIKYSAVRTVIQVDLWVDVDSVVFQVIDEGMGIPPEDHQRIFDPFFRGTNTDAIGGTGLGLSIVKDCVDRHNGTIEVDSTLGSGTTFTVRLPI